MILINFSHPLTPEQRAQIEALAGRPLERVVELPVQFEADLPFLPQLQALFADFPLDAHTLQTAPILVVPPALNFITGLALAELHGRMGYFPPIVRLRPVPDALPPRYEAAEILNLQAVRDQARLARRAEGKA